MKHLEMKVYALVFVIVISLMTIGAVWAAERQFREPTIEERPVVERRLVCPEGFDLYSISPNQQSIVSGTSNYPMVFTTGSIITADTQGKVWQQGAEPNVKSHVCVTKEEAKKHERTEE